MKKITGVEIRDTLTGKKYEVLCKAVINATGVFSDSVQQLDDPHKKTSITASQGIHIVLDKEFLPGDAAIMIPNTDDGRVLFAVPWHNKIIVGTTDTLVSSILEEPVAQEEEIDFILNHAARYLTKHPSKKDIRSIFAGLRPLVKNAAKKTAEISRDHSVIVSESGLISVLGGKWTTYRKMAEDVVNTAAIHARLSFTECITKDLSIHGSIQGVDFSAPGYYYGADKPLLKNLIEENASLSAILHPRLPYVAADIIWAVRHEYCMTVEDALARRTRALLLDAAAAVEIAPAVAQLMANEMKADEAWQQQQIHQFGLLSRQYLPK